MSKRNCHCKFDLTVGTGATGNNTQKKIHPVGKNNQLMGKVGFCQQIRAFPVGKNLKCRR